MATYNISVTWKDLPPSSYGSKKEGIINLGIGAGNSIQGTWGKLTGSWVPRERTGNVWYDMYMDATLHQDQTYKYNEVTYQGTFYANQSYAFSTTFNTSLVKASQYKISLDCSMAKTLSPSTTMPLTVTSLTAEQPKNISFSNKQVYENISFTYEMVGNNECQAELWQDGQLLWSSSYTTSRTMSIPAGTIRKNSSCTLKIKSRLFFQGQTYYSNETSTSLSGLIFLTAVKPANITTNHKKIYENMTVSWDKVDGQSYEYKVTVNGVQKIFETNKTVNSFIIPYGTILSKDDNVVVIVKSKISKNGYLAESENTTYTISSLQTVTCETPKDVRFVGVVPIIEQSIKFAWTMQDLVGVKFTIEIWQNGAKIHTVSNLTSLEYILPAGTLKATEQIQFRVFGTKTINGYTHVGTYGSTNISNLQSYKPIIKDFVLSGTNLDYDITIAPEAEKADSYSLVINNATTIRGVVIPRGTLKLGFNKIKLIATASTGLEVSVSSELEKNFDNIVQDEPIIYSLEPSNININIQRSNVVSFSINEFCDSWNLFINNLKYSTGTTERIVSVDANVFSDGKNDLILQSTYTPKYNGTTPRITSKAVFFTGYKKPTNPTLDSISVYNTACPKFTWTNYSHSHSDLQVEFQIKVCNMANEILEQRIINSQVGEYTTKIQLENNTEYSVFVSIKNTYGLWSDFSRKKFSTSFSSLPTPTLNLLKGTDNVTIECSVYQIPNFSDLRVYKREGTSSEWVCVADKLSAVDRFTDYTVICNKPTSYKVRVYDKHGAYSESSSKDIVLQYSGYLFSNILKPSSIMTTYCCDVSIKNNRKIITKTFANKQKPDIFYDSTNYESGTFSLQLTQQQLEEFESIITNGEVFCYRDWRGRKIYCSIILDSLDYVKYSTLYNVQASFIQVSFTEELMYSSAFVKQVAYLDGKYKLDGSLHLDGYILNDTREVKQNVK